MNAKQLYVGLMRIIKTIETPSQRWESAELGASTIEGYLANHPHDTEWFLRLARAYFSIADIEQNFVPLNKVFECDAMNLEAILMYAFFDFYRFGQVSEKVFTKLQFATPVTCCDKAMILLAISWYYEYLDGAKKILILEASAAVCRHCIRSWKFLSYSQNSVRRMIYSNYVLQFIIHNPHLINRDNGESFISLEEFFDEWYRGYYVPEDDLKRITQNVYGSIRMQSKALRGKRMIKSRIALDTDRNIIITAIKDLSKLPELEYDITNE